MQASENSYAVILAGGGGTRLWPKSRKANPKHLLNLFGDQSMLQMTFNRITPLIPPERILVVTLQDYSADIQKQLPNLPSANIIAEPQAKNTAMAMGVAAAFIDQKDPKGVVIYLAADHLIEDEEKFRQNTLLALETAAKKEVIVAIGINPKFAHTGLGYIKMGSELPDSSGVYEGLGFKEKPDLETAEQFLSSGNYLWNANIYCWSTKTIKDAFTKYAPDIATGLNQISEAINQENEQQVLARVYQEVSNVQIDHAISEKVDNLVVIPGDFGWNDVGDWKVVYDMQTKDAQGNVIIKNQADIFNISTQGSLIESSNKLIVTIGLTDLVIIDTPDALLICAKNATQQVKKAVEILKEQNKEEYL